MNTKYKKLQPRLTVMEAGFISIKGYRALASADVVIYTDTNLTHLIPAGIKKIYIGERDNYKAYTQEQINALIVDLAFSYGHVVLLTAVFEPGRKFEEIVYADVYNIETGIVRSGHYTPVALGDKPLLHRLFGFLPENKYLLN